LIATTRSQYRKSPDVTGEPSLTERPLRIGILGAGTIARDHADAIHALGHTVSAACSRSDGSSSWQEFIRAAPGARFESSGASLLRDPEIDAVVACLPWNVTESWLPDLLAAAKPVLIEKPLALSAARLKRSLERAQANIENKVVGFNRRFYEPVQKTKERLRHGGLKAAEIAVSEAVNRLAAQFGPEVIPHTLAYSSCHMLDAALYLLGPLQPVKLYRYTENDYPSPFRSMTGLLETHAGIPVTLSIHADAPVPVGMRFYFDDRTVWHLSPMERLTAYRGYEVAEPTAQERIRRYTPKPFLDCTAEASLKPGFLGQMRAFTMGGGREIAATPADSLAVLSLIESLQGIQQ
jgi:myo-inositol 2-dehydrogenase/D-chiro-inositol 1-dehydrogenase